MVILKATFMHSVVNDANPFNHSQQGRDINYTIPLLDTVRDTCNIKSKTMCDSVAPNYIV